MLQRPSTALWLDVDSTDREQHALLSDVFRFHPLAIEDTLNPRTRVKIEEYDGYVFIVLRAMRFDSDRVRFPRELGVKKMCLFLGPNYLVSVHSGEFATVDRVRARLDRNELPKIDPAWIAYAITDDLVDGYFPILDWVDGFVDRLEQSNLGDLDRSTFDDMLRVRRLAFAAHRSLAPQREMFETLAHERHALIPDETRLFFRDVHDHASRITDSLESYRELIGNTTDSYVARLSMRLNYATAMFSAIATIAVPCLIISGIYSMNFAWLPFSKNPHGFWIAVGAQAAISVALFVALRWRQLI